MTQAAEEQVATLIAKVATLTGMSTQELQDFLSMTPAMQLQAVQTYAGADWVKNRDTLADVISVLEVVGTLAGVVSGVAGAVTAVDALRSL
jgi:hypothetical protein